MAVPEPSSAAKFSPLRVVWPQLAGNRDTRPRLYSSGQYDQRLVHIAVSISHAADPAMLIGPAVKERSRSDFRAHANPSCSIKKHSEVDADRQGESDDLLLKRTRRLDTPERSCF